MGTKIPNFLSPRLHCCFSGLAYPLDRNGLDLCIHWAHSQAHSRHLTNNAEIYGLRGRVEILLRTTWVQNLALPNRKTISGIRVITVERKFARVSSKRLRKDCLLSWQAATKSHLPGDYTPASPFLKNPCFVSALAAPVPFGCPPYNLSSRFDLAGPTQTLNTLAQTPRDKVLGTGQNAQQHVCGHV